VLPQHQSQRWKIVRQLNKQLLQVLMHLQPMTLLKQSSQRLSNLVKLYQAKTQFKLNNFL
jgi:hypothetical protein